MAMTLHRQTLVLILPAVVVLLLALTIFPQSSSALDFDDYCDSARFPSSSHYLEYDPYKCDVTIGLYCNPYVAKCTCFVTDSEYSHYYDRCVSKVGHPCKASPAFTIACVEGAECGEDTGFCKCRDHYVSNEYKTACYRAGAGALRHDMGLIVAIAFIWGAATFVKL